MKKIDYMKPLYKKVKIVDVRYRTLSNGKVIPTWSMMERLITKI